MKIEFKIQANNGKGGKNTQRLDFGSLDKFKSMGDVAIMKCIEETVRRFELLMEEHSC